MTQTLSWTEREINQQPGLWPEVATLVESERPRVASFLAPLRANPDLRIALTGAGSSSYVGAWLAPHLWRHGLRCVQPIATTDLVAAPDVHLERARPTLLVSFSRSGGSPESVAAMDLAEQALDSVHHLVITCNAGSALARRTAQAPNACLLTLPEASNDRAFAMTSSVTSMLISAAMVFEALTAASVERLARACTTLLPRAQALARSLAARRFERCVFLGSNELRALADEAALKLLELSDGRTVAMGQSVLGFRHGPKTIINERTLVVVFTSNDAYTRAYDRDLIAELRREGRAGLVLAVGADHGDLGDAQQLPIDDATAMPDFELALLAVVFAQEFGLRQSLELGLTPDMPNSTGVISRVVQGVTVHEWSRRR